MKNKFTALRYLLIFYLLIGILVTARLLFPAFSTSKAPSSEETLATLPDTVTTAEEAAEIVMEENVSEESSAEEWVSSPYYRFVTTNKDTSLNVRLSPGEGAIIGTLEPNSTGYILEFDEKWCRIKYYRMEGYVSTDFLELEEITMEEHPYSHLVVTP